MKSFLIIGMSTFGAHLCKMLTSLGSEVMIADKNSETVEAMMRYAVSAKIADCTNTDVLKSFGVDEFDACFVCLGDHFSETLEITFSLKELGAKKVFSEVNRDIESKFLLRNGADRVVYPEYDLAQRIAVSESNDSIFDAIELTGGYCIYEISTPRSWRGKTIRDLNIRQRHNLNIIATKKGEEIIPALSPEYVFCETDHLLVMGHIDDINNVI
ncbi:MAG: TrkA family potassium uptake protein [Oscillospiraceae bacterium]|nr:TrkA family potassium uptake protein [Oscillospiraceae bacterium]